MKKMIHLKSKPFLLALVLLACFSGCNKSNTPKIVDKSIIETAYNSFLQDINQNDVLYYTFKDIDGNGTDELLVTSNTKLTIYVYDHSVKEIGNHDFQTGTLRLLHTNHEDYPGIICFTAGGSAEHYKYLTIHNEQLLLRDLWKLDYSNDNSKQEINYCDDAQLIDLSKEAYNNNQDIDFKVFK